MNLTINQLTSPVYGSDGTLVAEGCGIGQGARFIGTILRETDAQQIVRACNAHADLLAALEQLMKAEPMQQGERNGYVMGAISQAIDMAREALAKAKGA